MKKVLGIIFVLIFFALLLKVCIRADIESVENKNSAMINNDNIIFPKSDKNITIDGIDYLQSQAPIGKFGGKVVISIIGEGPKTFNPANTKDAVSSSMTGLLYDGLLTTNPRTGDVIPQLAKSFKIVGNDYIITLRNGLKWSDGKPITVDDVEYTYNEVVFKGLGNPSTMDAMLIDGKLPQFSVLNANTVKFTIPKAFAPFLRQLTYPILPKHYFKPYSDKGASVFNTFLNPDTKPSQIVSNGAFMLKEYVPAQRVVFVRNPNYYKINTNNQKLPYIDKLVYLIVGDTNNEILKFEAKEIDIIGLKGGNVARYKQKEPDSDYVIYNLGADTGTLFIALNLSREKNKDGKYYVNPVKQKWFSNPKFRKAIDYAIDRKAMVQNIAFGVAEPLYTAESLNSIYLNKNIKGHSKDKDKALELLKSAGFEYKYDRLYDAQGNLVEFDLYTNAGNIEREAIGVMIKQDLEEVGMKVNFKPIEFNSLVNKLTNSYDWDMVIMGLTGSPLEPHDGKNVWTTTGTLHMFNQNPSEVNKFSWEKELDDIFNQASLKLSYNERKPLYDRYQEIIYEQNPMIYLYSPSRITAIRKWIKNIFPSKLSGVLYNPEEVYIDKEE